jgi:FG-GAP-like repeat
MGFMPGDSIYYRRGDTYTASTFVFAPGKDRHACASADVNGDGWLDLYCTTGADQGQSLNPNELWMGVNGTDFRRVHRKFGAEDPSGRGRLTSFLNFNGDDKPDLFVSVWGKRSDGALNESSIYINRGARFERIATAANGMKGAACQAVADINGDNL